MAEPDDVTLENIRQVMQNEDLTRQLCACFVPAPGDPENGAKVDAFRKLLERQEREVLAQVDEELSRLRGEFVRKVSNMFECKLHILNRAVQDLVQSGGSTAKPPISDALRSLLTFEVRRVEGFRCESFAYIRGCDALPQRLHFIESYEAQVYHVGSTVNMYYLSSMGCDPLLIHYIAVSVTHETGEDAVKVRNWDLLNGMYHLEFVVDREGTYEARVTLYDRDINGSPQKVTVQSAPVHEWLDRGATASITDATRTGNIGGSVLSNTMYNEWPIHAVRKEVSDLASRQHDSKLLTIRANELRIEHQPPVSQTLSVEAPSSSDSSKIFESVKAVPRHCSNLVTTSTSDLDSYFHQPVFRALPSAAGQGPSDTRISEPPPNSAPGKFFSHAGPPHKQATTTRSGAFSGQISASSGLSLDFAGSSNLSSSRPILQHAHIATSEAVLQPPQVAKSENTSSCGSSLLNDKPGALKSGSGKCMEEPLKPTYVVKTIASDSSTKLSSASIKVPPTSTHKKEHVSFSGTITAKLTLEFDGYGNHKFAFPIGVTSTSSGKMIIANTSQNRVVAFAPEGRALHEATFLHSSDQFDRPSAVVAFKDESYAVKDNHCIYIFSKNGEFIRKLGEGSLCRPYGLALQGEENLFTLSLGDSVPTLRCFSASGNFEQCVAYGPLVPSPPTGSKCRFMDVHDGHVFVSDLGLSCIYKTDMKGVLESTFGTKGKRFGQMIEPSGISATERCIFIGDSKNDRVQAFDASGKFITVVEMACAIRRPSGIHVSERNKLYVLNYLDGALGVYDLYFNESAP